MNVLFISKDLSGASLCYRLKKEGHAVRLFVEEKENKGLKGMVEQVDDWKKELPWVGQDGLIVFDYTGFGKDQDELRSKGYSVVGGSYFGDKLEEDRQYGQKVFSLCGIDILPTMHFHSAEKAIEFIQKNGGRWVIKQNGHADKIFNYVGELEDGSDAIEVLRNYAKNHREDCNSIDLQENVDGIEIAVGRYFNGNDWVGPMNINFEHKSLFNRDLGPKTYEMGTLMWYEKNEKNRLFRKTLAKMKPYLKKINFKGYFDINCIVNGKKMYPLEATTRFGYPTVDLQSEIQSSPWGEFLKAMADGKKYNPKYQTGFGIIVLVATPPFPYGPKSVSYSPKGITILFKKEMKKIDMDHVHLQEVSLGNMEGEEQFYIADKNGYVLHVTGMGKTVEEARKKTYKIIDKIVIPKMFYRTDIGLKFIEEDCKKLKKWGWI